MAVPSKPSYSVQPPSIVATDQTVTLAVYCDGATQLGVYVARAEYVEDLMWSGTFSPISSTAGLFSCPVPLASANLESGTQYVFFVQGRNSDGTSQSVPAYFVAVDRPIVTITTPTDGATITALPLVISWDVTDETGVSAQAVIIYHGGDIVYSRYGIEIYLRSLEIHASDVEQPFVDGDAYRVNVYVRNGAGLEVNVQNNFSISWAAPVTPTATVTTDPDALAASVTVTAGAGTPPTDTLMVVRVNPDGTRHVLADDLESGDSVTDPLPPLGVEYSYEVTGIAESGVPSAPATVTHTNVTTYWALNFGADASELLVLYGNPKESYGLEHGGRAYHFADGGAGRGLPVWYGTSDRDISGTTTFDTVLWHDSDRLQELCDSHAVGWMRDPHGHRRRVRMEPKVSHGVGEVWQVTVSWDEMRWEEPANG